MTNTEKELELKKEIKEENTQAVEKEKTEEKRVDEFEKPKQIINEKNLQANLAKPRKVHQKEANKKVKAYFIDLDGTLLDTTNPAGKHDISEANLEAIRNAQKEGKTIVISTGRSSDATHWLQQVNSPFAILANGAQVVVEDKIVRNLKLSVRQSLLIHDFAWKNGLVFKLNAETTAYGAFTFWQKFLSKKFGFIPQANFNYEMHKEYTKFVLWGKSKKEMDLMRLELIERIPNASIVTSSKGYSIEITHEDATKGKAAEFIWTKYLNLKKEETAHIGDSMNDSTTVGHVGRLIAMKNSDKNLKQLTKFEGPKHKKGGVAKILAGDYTKR